MRTKTLSVYTGALLITVIGAAAALLIVDTAHAVADAEVAAYAVMLGTH